MTAARGRTPDQRRSDEPRIATSRGRGEDRWGPQRFVLALGILAVAANMRPPLASVAPVLSLIRVDLGLSSALAAVLTAAPVLCFGLLAPVARPLAGRFGDEATMLVGLGVLVAGLLLRVGPTWATLLAGTILVGGAISIANVMLPVLVKREFPGHIGLVTGIYVTVLSVASALAAAITVPIGAYLGFGWRGALGFWCIPVLTAIALWAPQLRQRTMPGPIVPMISLRTVLGSPVAWSIALLFGLQALDFYAVLAWLPTFFQGLGYTPQRAGQLLSVVIIAGAPAALLVPGFSGRTLDQRPHIALATGCVAVGLVGLLIAPAVAPLLWCVVLGVGQGSLFPLALILIALRSRAGETTIRLSVFTQGVGYVLAAAGPFAAGLVHDFVGSWTSSLALLLALLVPQVLAGLVAGRPGVIDRDR